MAEEESKPTFSGGLKKGHEEFRQMWPTPRGRLTILVVLGSMFWLFFIAPATCMKLEEVFPHTGIWFFVGLAMYFSWFLFLFIIGQLLRRRRKMLFIRQTQVEFRISHAIYEKKKLSNHGKKLTDKDPPI